MTTSLPFSAASRSRHLFKIAHREFLYGVFSPRLWFRLGAQDIHLRYKRTVLGPWWISASQTATFICMGMLFSAVLKNDINLYLPYLAAGMIVWSFIATTANEAPRAFLDSSNIIASLPVPLVVHVLRASCRNAFIFLHNFCPAIAVSWTMGGHLTANILWLGISLPLLFIIISAMALLLAIVGLRFRDLGPVIGIAAQLGFFVTPIMWHPEDIPNASKWWVAINPAHHLIETIRAPMLGLMPSFTSLIVVACFAVASSMAAYLAFCLSRHRIPYWL